MKRRFLALLMGLGLLVALAACGTSRPSAQSVTEDAIQAVQAADLASLQQYWGGEMLDEETLGLKGEDAELLTALTKNLTYKVVSAEEDESAGTAVVSVEFTNTDMAPVMGDLVQSLIGDAFQYAFLPEDQQPTDEELSEQYMQKFTELLNAEDLTTKTTSVEIPLTLVEDQWQVTPDEAIVDAMFGGLLTVADSMDEAFSE